MSKVYVISDTHFGHRRIIEFEAAHRPFKTIEEHDRVLVERWNAVVKDNDTVWHLGDVYFGSDPSPLFALKGYKKLVLGNHDYKDMEVYRQVFSRIFGAAEYGRCMLTHIPIHPYQLESRYKLNIHGHLHSKKLEDNRYRCVSCEHTELAPVLLQTVIQHDENCYSSPKSS